MAPAALGSQAALLAKDGSFGVPAGNTQLLFAAQMTAGTSIGARHHHSSNIGSSSHRTPAANQLWKQTKTAKVKTQDSTKFPDLTCSATRVNSDFELGQQTERTLGLGLSNFGNSSKFEVNLACQLIPDFS